MNTPSAESDKPAPAAILAEQEALHPGTRFGELEIVRVLGVGGFGIVYLARDHSLERDVALKEYMPAALATRGQGPQITVRSTALTETYAVGLRSFINEARLLARFDHPSLVKVYRFWEDNATAYMVMPYLQGRTLRDARRAMSGPPEEAWLRRALLPIMGALEVMHREDVFHRDIAPDNILLPDDGPPVLLDFGAARRVIGDRTQSLTAILKPSYAPIEQYADMTAFRQGPWTDLYALGAVAHFLLRGAPPPPATGRAVQDELAPLQGGPFPGVSARFLAAIDWALAVRPQDRPQNVEALRAVLEGRAEPPALARAVPGHTVATPAAAASSRTGYEPTQIAAKRPDPTFEPTVRAGPAITPRAPAAPPTAAAPSPTSRKGLVGAALVVTAVLAVAGWRSLATHEEASPSVAAAPAPVAAPAPAAVKVAVPAPADEPASAASLAAVPSPVAAPATAAPAVATTAPAAEVVPAVATASPRPRAVVTHRAAPVEAAPIERPHDLAAPASETGDASRPRTIREAIQASRQQPLGAPVSGPATAHEACGHRVLLALWNCMQRECRKARYAQQPECVKVNEERRQRALQ